MADKLIVRDFGPIKEAELDIKKTTLLIGPQGSGKSTLAKLVAVASNSSWDYILNGDPNFRNYLSDYGIANYKGDQSEFSYSHGLTNVKYQESLIEINSNENLAFNAHNAEREETVLDFNNKQISNEAKRIKLEGLVINSVYIPSERIFLPIVKDASLSMQLNKIPLPTTVLLFGNQFEFARKNIHALETLIPGASYRNENGQDTVSINGKSLELSETASGYQALIPMQLIVNNLTGRPNSIFIIEEPELNLYPPTQKALVQYLSNYCTKSNNKLLLTTHSPYVLSSLNNLLFAYKVAQRHPEQEGDIANIIPKESWVNPDEFAAYFVANGTVRSIVNPKTGLISENELDGVSESIGDEFDALMEIYSAKANEGSY